MTGAVAAWCRWLQDFPRTASPAPAHRAVSADREQLAFEPRLGGALVRAGLPAVDGEQPSVLPRRMLEWDLTGDGALADADSELSQTRGVEGRRRRVGRPLGWCGAARHHEDEHHHRAATCTTRARHGRTRWNAEPLPALEYSTLYEGAGPVSRNASD